MIEHGLLRGNARPPYSLRRSLQPADPQLRAAPSAPDARIHFALNCGARSCPPRRVYEGASVDQQLDDATRAYLGAECEFDRGSGRVVLPGLIKLYSADFGDRGAQLELVASHLSGQAAWLREEGPRLRVRYARFDWTIVG